MRLRKVLGELEGRFSGRPGPRAGPRPRASGIRGFLRTSLGLGLLIVLLLRDSPCFDSKLCIGQARLPAWSSNADAPTTNDRELRECTAPFAEILYR